MWCNGNADRINFERDSVDTFYPTKDTFQDANVGGNVKEKQRVSTESSRVSFSSSCSSSSPSSSELNRGVRPEASAYEQANFTESPTSDPEMTEGNGFSHLGLDLRDVVRDSMYREARGPMTRDEVVRRSRREDSPRPYGLKQSTPADLNESFRFLAKLRETPQHYSEVGARDAPRYSVDSHDTLKSRQKLKELPRLSLDSRERVMQNANVDLKSAKLSESFSGSSSSNKKRPPSVVAKLMGLDTLPSSPLGRDSLQFGLIKVDTSDHNNDPFSRSVKEKNLNRSIRFSPSSPRSLGKDPSSPRWRNSDFVMKPLSSSKFPMEPAPWKQADRNRVLQKQASMPVKPVPSEVPKFPPTVYSEMERRLNDLEFKHSGKDLRALKQILEAMQSKGFLDTEKQPQPSNLAAQRDSATSNQAMPSKTRVPASSSSSNQVYQSPIVIMKPAKLVEKAGIPASSLIPIHSLSGLNKIRREKPDDKGTSTSSTRVTKDRNPGNRRAESCTSSIDKKSDSRSVQSSSKKPQQVAKESTSKNSGSVSPRLQQKKLEYDKRSRPPTPPSDSSKSRKPLNRQLAESTSPGGRRRPTAQKTLQQNDDQYSQMSYEPRMSSHDMCTQSEAEAAAGVEQATEADGGKSPSVIEAAKAVVSNLMQNKSSPRFSEDGSSGNLSLVALEHPSPISVLDGSMYREIEPSPVKAQGNVVHDFGDEHCEDQWNPAYSFSETTSSFSPEINRKKLQNVEHLVQKLRRLNSSHDEANQDYIGSLCENADPNTDHRYISEILLASGLLLRDLGSGLTTFQLHPSGHPINPELFFVLEQTKGSSTMHLLHKDESKVLTKEKLNRKLVFDTVNEILVEKLASVEATTNPLMKSSAKMTKKAMSAQQLLKELCSTIETMQKQATKRSENFLLEEEDDFLRSVLAEDVMVRSGNWVDFNGEISGLVLDVERLIFKDLVNEIVHAETSRMQAKSGRRRTLFAGQ
ncbi:hypothetical protein AALP_AA2G180400 [Arabis alpina]|uniref:DUF4378 domain-containing protein n=1 Tax=Arabis alpina TaxID=50452 RepID=A0A087HIA9_ARAAL|nr:hypothetical protein AALP_AA2G180400 [Arabis alpina]